MKRTCLLPVLALMLCLSACRTQKSSSINQSLEEASSLTPKSDHIDNVLGLPFQEVYFSWEIPGSVNQQKAFEIMVASDSQKLAADVGDLWESGKRYTSNHSDIQYQGKNLSKTAYWKVRIWSEDGPMVPFCQAQTIELEGGETSRFSIALLGGTHIANMEKYGWFEQGLTAQWPNKDINFRNIGWPADDVFGTARSEFGSALNTASWKPPDPEAGYGIKVLQEHIELVDPDVLIIGYGAEAAFADTEEKFQAFEKGYRRLVKAAHTQGAKLILLSPHRFWKKKGILEDVSQENDRLDRAARMIRSFAKSEGHRFVDVFENFKDIQGSLSENGIHLNEAGHKVFAELLLKELGLNTGANFSLEFTNEGQILQSQGVNVSQFTATHRGFRINVHPDKLGSSAELMVPGKHLLKINGKIQREAIGESRIFSPNDGDQLEALRKVIIEKNRLHRFRINPLNKVYTHLFRQHEMGHLAYETEDYVRLTEEKDELISQLKKPQVRRYEVELLDAWVSPRVYPDHEVPSFIPKPNIEEELDAFTVAEGFEINLFASDPMIANPISITWDNKGRAWVGTSSTYPQIKPGLEPIDKVVILEDLDKDGKADKNTVFAEGILIPHAVMPVKGGAYVSNTTELLFMPDKNGDDKADASRLIYGGFGHGDVHHTIHSMRWAPWGDLYFSQSININSFVETPYGFRKINGSGFWEFRPETKRLDVFARGMINPWGQAFDDWGQVIATDGAGSEGPTYLFPGSAHVTAVGVDRVLHGMLRGKPKNTGAEFMSGSHIPDHWQGSLLASDFRANRTVRYRISPKGSGYAAEELETVLRSSHRSFRPVDVKQGPDGAIYIVDWYSPIIDHGEVDFYHPARDKSHGRVWRITAKDRPIQDVKTAASANIRELLEMLKLPAQFHRIQANRELVRRELAPGTLKSWANNLSKFDPSYERHRLEALWLGVALNAPDKILLEKILSSSDPRARAAAIRMVDRMYSPNEGEKLVGKFVKDGNPQVRLEAVNTLRRLGSSHAVAISMEALEYEVDESLDYILWSIVREHKNQWLPKLKNGKQVFGGDLKKISYALQAANDADAIGELAKLTHTGRLNGAEKENALILVANLGGGDELAMILEEALKQKSIRLLEALANAPRSNTNAPKNVGLLTQFLGSESSELRSLAAQLMGRYTFKGATDKLAKIAGDPNIPVKERLSASSALLDLGENNSLAMIANGHTNPMVRATAISAWAKQDIQHALEPALALVLSGSSHSASELILNTFFRLKGGARMFEKALTGKKLDEQTAVLGIRIAQASGRNMEGLIQVMKTAGDLKPIGVVLDDVKRKQLLADAASNGNSWRGKQVYYRPSLLCARCHEVDGEGGEVGPNLTTLGSYMTPESILESLINPNSDIKQGYETVIVTKTDGTVVSGMLSQKTESAALIRDANGKIIKVLNEEVEKMEVGTISLMPPGLTAQLRYDELVDLMTFLTNLGK